MRIPYSLLLALAAFVLTFALTPLVRLLAVKVGALDRPGPRRVHTEPVPTLGGLAFAAAYLITLYGAFALPGPPSLLDIRAVIGFSLAAIPILLLGVIDDVRGAPPWLKLLLQALAACILYAFRIRRSDPHESVRRLGRRRHAEPAVHRAVGRDRDQRDQPDRRSRRASPRAW
jgi:UDP-GlcNAc:undecaprenyl-phosphate GlcNAc-1-phosphate transferase